MGKMAFAQTITTNSIEIDYMKALISYITDIDSAIECLDDPDDEYDVETVTTDHTPTFRFTIDSIHVFTIKRGGKLSSSASEIDVSIIINGQSAAQTSMRWGGNYAYTAIGQRQIDVSYIISNGLYLFNFCGTSSYSSRQRALISFVKNGNSKYETHVVDNILQANYTISKVFDLSGYVFQDIDESIAGTFLSRFVYKAQPGKVDYIKSAVYANNGVKQFDLTCIYDCTEVATGSTVSLEDGAYLAVGSHQLVKVS